MVATAAPVETVASIGLTVIAGFERVPPSRSGAEIQRPPPSSPGHHRVAGLNRRRISHAAERLVETWLEKTEFDRALRQPPEASKYRDDYEHKNDGNRNQQPPEPPAARARVRDNWCFVWGHYSNATECTKG